MLKTILFFARDPGGANAILPVYKKAEKKYHTVAYAKQYAAKRLEDAGIPVRDIEMECKSESFENVKSFLKKQNPDLVITGTSLDDFTERYLWKAAGELGITSYAILDQWTNLGIRFSGYDYTQEEEYEKCRLHTYLPSRILVMDTLAKQWLMRDGIEESRIAVTGQPHFDTVSDRYQKAGRCYDSSFWNVVFVSEPISKDYDGGRKESYWGFNEKTIFFALYKSLVDLSKKQAAGRNIRLIIRPHPREAYNDWGRMAGSLHSEAVHIEVNTSDDSFAVMKSADLACGMSSMFLLESVICQKPVLSIEIGLIRKNPFVLDQIGCCRSILSEQELSEALLKVFCHKSTQPVHFEFIKHASDNVMQLIEEDAL